MKVLTPLSSSYVKSKGVYKTKSFLEVTLKGQVIQASKCPYCESDLIYSPKYCFFQCIGCNESFPVNDVTDLIEPLYEE